ncbi:uncharacterized protein LOC129875176 [Solanum dulcamara]|uniref:uncharacterized protein LOC129875176 n=1 Tax=Solanum dulcamara TaxID=45834 RepID=UPI002486BC0D|nr:uncharacterized protein LOC129875176 [Solanum dulcamara]
MRLYTAGSADPLLVGLCWQNSTNSPDMVQQAMEKVMLIQERLLVAWSRQKSYANNQHRPLEFQVAYELDLAVDLEAMHPVFHVSMLYKCVGDPYRVYPIDDIQVTEDLSYEEKPIAILDRNIRRLRTKDVAFIKVLWRNENREEMT